MARIRKRRGVWEFEIPKTKKHRTFYKNGYRTKREAEKAAKRIEVMIEQGDYNIELADLTLPDLFERWLQIEIDPQPLDPETKKRYRKRLGWIEDFFQNRLISQIRRSDYQMFLNRYGEHYEINEVGRMHANVVKAIEFAKGDLINVDDRFVLNIKLHSQKRPKDIEKKYLSSRADYEKLIDYLLIHMDYRRTVLLFVIYLIFTVGLRPSEALALTWPDFDFENQEVYTYRRWSSSKHMFVPAKNDHFYRKLNRKNPSKRSCPLNSQVLEVFLELKSLQERMLKLLGLENEEQFVFFQIGAKHPVPDESTLNTCLKRILKKLKIEPVITVYGGRHTYGSIKVQEGVPLEVLAKWFGHKDTTTLRETYVHLLDETRDEWFEREKNNMGQNMGQRKKGTKKSPK
ncbi:site-specific integrase [Streptococcus chenjunshii]|uniref:Site-specific integrase n=1 Tax=Streptococcus chenjunshii TaxID=2173853 RepID=A0A372KKE6_9STRE|nr:site-specific integrase [Streptococcus chenjunshii]AXQ77783.1 site-specific integrase [Streptococcus chenjunshii]RFU50505.1 site-specific integrase [Streptococcus chenjunshii]RFU52733.1 site-specific integrase [Streptococcus chenjunshii]